MLALMIAGYAVAAGGLALRRHWNLESQALDMGYADQVAWNTLHGRPFRFTVFRGDVGAELWRPLRYGPGADRDSLLAYHVELLFLPLSLLYLVHAGPETRSCCSPSNWRWLKVPPATAALRIALAGLAIALAESRSQGILPPSPRFTWPPPSEHAARLRPLLAQVPADAAVSAQSNVFPHLSRRERAYVIPTMENAEYVLVDVAGTSDPLYPDDLFAEAAALLASPRYRLLAADDGFLLFRRFAPGTADGGSPAATPPASFYEFARAAERFTPVRGSFAGVLDVAGYAAEARPAHRSWTAAASCCSARCPEPFKDPESRFNVRELDVQL